MCFIGDILRLLGKNVLNRGTTLWRKRDITWPSHAAADLLFTFIFCFVFL